MRDEEEVVRVDDLRLEVDAALEVARGGFVVFGELEDCLVEFVFLRTVTTLVPSGNVFVDGEDGGGEFFLVFVPHVGQNARIRFSLSNVWPCGQLYCTHDSP